MKKLAALTVETEECDIESERFPKTGKVPENKTLIKKVKDCKPFIGVSILFLCVSIILIRIMIYFYLKLKNNNVLP